MNKLEKAMERFIDGKKEWIITFYKGEWSLYHKEEKIISSENWLVVAKHIPYYKEKFKSE